MDYNKITKTLIITTSLSATFAYANNFAVDGRGNGMGGTGVVSATYLTAPFYNPALTAVYRRNDQIGMILPGIGITVQDEDNLLDDFMSLQDITDPTDLEDAVYAMEGDEAKIELGMVAAFAIPNPALPTNFYAKAYTESYLAPDIPDTFDPDAFNVAVDAVSIGVFEIGMSMAKYANVLGNHMSFGVTPKIQWITTYYQNISLGDNMDLGSLKENANSGSAFNFDAGGLWFYGPLRVGLSGKNLIKREITTETVASTGNNYTYQLTPVYTAGAGYVDDYFTLSVDYDLNEDKKYEDFDDNVKMLRVGFEFDMYGQMQIRGGYKSNMAKENDDTYTLGLGLSPLGLAHMDFSASYKSMENFGVYANILVSY
jgi:hypothetical protein